MDLKRKAWPAVVAVLFFAIGFFVADHMTAAKAEAAPAAQEFPGASFSGTDGAVVFRSSLFIIRGNKIWKLDANQSQSLNNKVWGAIE